MEAGNHRLHDRTYHPAHPQPNALVLRQYNTGSEHVFNCKICLNEFEMGDYIYACHGSCSDLSSRFIVDIACSPVKAKIDFHGHEHLLFFFEKISLPHSLRCHSCYRVTYELMFRCVMDGCFYSLHLSCGPLPVDIRYYHIGHKLTLTLRDTLLDGADPEDSWCDICEQQRDPTKCVYCSEDPPFTATIDCALPQIVGALQGDHGEVKLRTVRGHIPGTVLVTAQGSKKQELGEETSGPHGDAKEVMVERKIEINVVDVEDNIDFTFDGEVFIALDGERIFGLLSQEDQEVIRCAFTEVGKIWSVDDIDYVINFKFSDEAFEQFTEHAIIGEVDFSILELYDRLERKPRFVKVGTNLVLPELVPLYRRVIDKQGDFTAGSPLSPIGKAVLLMMLLLPIHDIQGLQICEITGDHLCNLKFYLKLASGNLGFDVKFALDNLDKLARACYALKFVKARDDTTTDLTQQIEQLERDIVEDKPKIEALKEQYRRGKKISIREAMLG